MAADGAARSRLAELKGHLEGVALEARLDGARHAHIGAGGGCR